MTTTSTAMLHSRSRLAGYDPERLFNACAVVVGAGALGQNLAQDLALAGIGQIAIVDFDVFEPHNATRSPLYPSTADQIRWGIGKARTVAHGLADRMTAPNPVIYYAASPVQALGDAPFVWADLVFSAVDSATGRAWLSSRCQLVGKPLFEAGFAGEAINLSVYGPAADDACWLCLHTGEESAYSCTRYARISEAQEVIPAIQNAAAVVAGLLSETGIRWLHGDQALRGKTVFGSIREMSLRTVSMVQDANCQWAHRRPQRHLSLAFDTSGSFGDLLKTLRDDSGEVHIHLPSPVVMRIPCTRCGTLVHVMRPEWRWLQDPRCETCGGPYAPADAGRSPATVSWISTAHPGDAEDLLAYSCRVLGIGPGTWLEVWSDSAEDRPTVVALGGTIHDAMQRVGAETT